MEKGLIHELIPKIMGEVGAIPKGKKSPQGYSYRGIDDALLAIQPLLSKHGVFFATEVQDFRREEKETQRGGKLTFTILKVRFVFYAKDGSSVDVVTLGEGMDSSDKSSNKAMSAALKYALFQLFCIPTEDPMDDSEAHDDEPDHEHIAHQVDRAMAQDKGINPSKQAQLLAIGEKNGWDNDSLCHLAKVKHLREIDFRRFDAMKAYIEKNKGPLVT